MQHGFTNSFYDRQIDRAFQDARLLSLADHPRLVLFSDEPDEEAEMLARVPAFVRFALEIDRGAPSDTLRRMTAMEELVMSCSSFSWWGAWLGNTRKVIVPRDWFVGGVEDYRDIYLPHWVTL